MVWQELVYILVITKDDSSAVPFLLDNQATPR